MTTARDFVFKAKWIGLLIMLLAFPAHFCLSGHIDDVIMAFGFGVALSLGVVDALFTYENTNTTINNAAVTKKCLDNR